MKPGIALRRLSHELRETQKDLRILSHVAWDQSIEARFHRGQSIDTQVRKLYSKRRPRFELDEKLGQLRDLRAKVRKKLGVHSAAGQLLLGRIADYENVAHLIAYSGRDEFATYSRALWGTSRDQLFSDGTTILQYARRLQSLIKTLITPQQSMDDQKVIPAAAVVELMKAQFRQVHLSQHIQLILSDRITANAAAGAGKIKIKRSAMFSPKDVQVLIYHEAYTHVATTMNGASQPFAKFLAFDSPRCTSTQEGLAVLMEIFSNTTYPARLKKIADRVIAVGLVEDGHSPKQVHDYLCGEGYRESEAYQLMSRAFRGTALRPGQAFGKDLSYLTGLVECFNFIQYCLVRNKTDLLPLLFVGKLNLAELPYLEQLREEKLLAAPQWVPSPFLDLDALSSWFVCTQALGQLGDHERHARYRTTFEAAQNETLDLSPNSSEKSEDVVARTAKARRPSRRVQDRPQARPRRHERSVGSLG